VPKVDSGTVALGTTSGPDIALFKRFQPQWIYIDKDKFETANDDLFTGMPEALRQEMRSFYADAIYSKVTRRDDYRGLLWLCHVFFGGSIDSMSGFRAPGAMHKVGWMAMDGKGHLFPQDVPVSRPEQVHYP